MTEKKEKTEARPVYKALKKLWTRKEEKGPASKGEG